MAAGSHNKRFSKVIFDRRQARTHRMPGSVFRSGPSEDAVQRGPRSKCAGRGAGRGVERLSGSSGPGQLCFKRLNTAVRGFLPRAATMIFFFNLKFAPKSLRCHVDFAVTRGVTRPNACGCYALLLYQSVSINSQTFTNKLISIYCPPPML